MSCKNCFLRLLALVLQSRSWLIFKETPDYWNNTETNLTVWKPIYDVDLQLVKSLDALSIACISAILVPFWYKKSSLDWLVQLWQCGSGGGVGPGGCSPCLQAARQVWYPDPPLMTENCKSDCKETGKPWSRYSFHICPLKELTGIILIIFSHIIQRICLQPFQPFDTWEGFIMLLLVSFFFFTSSCLPFVFYPPGAVLLMVL